MSGLKEKTVKGAFWITLERFTAHFVSYGVGLILARILTPHDYGTVALLGIFITVAGSLASCGFGKALVQRKDAGDLEFNSVFYASLALAGFVYAILALLAPAIARFYGIPELCPITRVIGVQLIFHAIDSVQSAELARKMLFNLQFRVNCLVCVASAATGLVCALLGFGPWALVLSTVVSGLVGVIARWFIIAWRPRLMFSFVALRGLFSYGWKLTLAGLINGAYEQLYGFLVGKVYSPTDLALVEKGYATPLLIAIAVHGPLFGVMFPALARLQDEVDRFRDAMRRMIQCSSFLMFPLMVGMAVCAKPVILVLFGDQWLDAVPYVQIACFSKAMAPFTQINVVAISAQGRSDILLKLEFIKKGFGLVLMLLSIRWGILAFMATIAFVSAPFAVIVNMIPNSRLLGYRIRMQFRDVMPSFLLSAAMALVLVGADCLWQFWVEPKGNAFAPALLEVIVKALIGGGLYFCLAMLFKVNAMKELLDIVPARFKKYEPGWIPRMRAYLNE